MKAGQLDQRVTIQRRTMVQNPNTGAMVESWAPLFTTWAAVTPLVGREYLAAAALVAEVTARVRMRYRPGITAADRIVHDGKVYGITSVADVHSSRRELQLMCKAIG